MKTLALAAMGSLVLVACQPGAAGGGKLATQDDSVSYILGYKMGENLKQQSVPVKPELIFRGLKEGMAGTTSTIPDSAMQATMMAFQVRMMGIQRQKDSADAVTQKAEGEKFLADNKGKEGVKTTPSGLQYKVLVEGSGPRPKATNSVTVNYRGTLIDGKEFDASANHGGPATLLLNQMIPGWTEGLQLMNVGSKYQFWIPAELGWGPQGSPPTIPPNAVVVFEVELLSFK